MNKKKDIYKKINPKNYKLIDNNIKNNNGNESPKISISTEKKKNYINYRKIDFDIQKNLEVFCDILEQFYYNSFKNFYNFFIKNLISFSQQKNVNRVEVLRRLKDGKKATKPNNIINNNSRKNINNVNNNNNNKEINDPRKNDKSPSKFVELQNNIMPSMMKIPIIEKRKIGENIRLLEESFDFENSKLDNNYNKYKTNTNVMNLYFPKKNNLKLNINLVNKNNINDIIKNASALGKDNFRGSLSTDNKMPILNKNTVVKPKKYINYDNDNINTNINTQSNIVNNSNVIKKYEYDTENGKIEDTENIIYYDTKIFKNQKYKISNSPEPYLNRDKSDKRLYNNIEQSQKSKNFLLYSKPLLKKSITKESDVNNNSNNINIINSKKNERNNIELKNNINISHSHNLINVNQNLSKAYNYNNQKSIFDNLNYKEEAKSILNQKKNKFGEIIIKNVCTKDKKLHVFIKYIEIGNNYIKNKNILNNKLIYKHTDSITLINKISKNNDNKGFIYGIINDNDNENDFDNINIEKNPFYKYRSNRHGTDEQNKINNIKNIDGDYQIKVNNSHSFNEENNNKINEDIKNSIIYLINILQNMFNDNKKLMIFNFFKNLRKIKTNALFHNSIKTREKKIFKNNNLLNSQRNNNKNIIEINNFNNYKVLNSNRSHDVKIKSSKTSNLKFDTSSLNKITRNKENDYSLNFFKNKPKLDDDIFKNNYKTKSKKNKEDIYFNNKRHYYNTSFNKSNNNICYTTNNSIYNDNYNYKKDLSLEDTKVKKIKNENDENVENKEKNINLQEKNKETLKKMKLAKLGKIFKNLEQENNIISAIKEQFLEWSNNNNLNLRKSGNIEEESDKKIRNKKYGIKTFDMKLMFNNPFYDENKNNKNNYDNNEFEEILEKFKNKLIIFSLTANKIQRIIKNKKNDDSKIDNSKYEGENEIANNEDEEKINDIKEKAIINNKNNYLEEEFKEEE